MIKTVSSAGTARLVSVKGELRVLAETDGLRQRVELRLLNGKTNRNNWRYENIAEHRKLFADTPILVAYVGKKIGDGHNFEEYIDENGNASASFMASTAERIVGNFRVEDDVRIEIIDGIEWIVGTGYLWKWYAQELVKKLRKQGSEGMSVSIETLVDEMHMDGNIEVFTKYRILGTTILGDDIAPAVASANIRALAAMGADEVKKITLRVASLNAENKNPQKNNEKKEKTKNMKLNDLAEKFKGYTVLAVDQNTVALLSANGVPYLSTAEKDGEEIRDGARIEATATAIFANGETKVEVPVETITEKLISRINELEKDNAAKDEAKATLEGVIKKLQTQETERRREAVKAAVRTRISENCINIDLSEDDCADLLTDEKIDEYCAMETKDGKFIGEERACGDVDARCMAKIREAAKAKTNKKYAWDTSAENNTEKDSDDVQAMIDEMTNKR